MFIGALYEKSLNIELQCTALHRNNNKSLNPSRCSLSYSLTSVTGIVIILKLCKVTIFLNAKNYFENHSQDTKLIK